jgi:peptidoglycan hydrolase-like protein with peptidoglycan-binding domain
MSVFLQDTEPNQEFMSCERFLEQPVLLYFGSQGQLVRELQGFLASLGCYSGVSNGYFNLETAASVCAFQHKIGIAATGVVDARTWRAIARLRQFLGMCY